ncbi:MAG: LysM domain-containing protein [Dehalococcoidia bacterium]|nr:LysM peptidoglycan-binding domain-containing protein [Dehalococcoidia bacterium]
MSFPEETIDTDATCEYLGLADDADSHATYATEAHRCYKLPNPTRIATGHQESYCLGANHVNCPVFQGEGVPQTRPAAGVPAAAPDAGPPVAAPAGTARGQRRPPQPGQRRRQQSGTLGPRPRSGGISMPVATIGLFALAIALVALAFLIQRALSDGDGGDLTPAETFATTQALNATQTAQAGGGNETQQPGQTQTQGTGETPGNGQTQTTEPQATNTPTNGGGGGTTYEVVSGDTCGAIASQFDTTVPEIIAANDLSEDCAINVGQVLKIP